MQQGLCEIDGKIQLHDSRVDLQKKKNNGLTDKGSQTDDFNVIRESYNKMCDHILQIMLYLQMNYATIIQDFHQLLL